MKPHRFWEIVAKYYVASPISDEEAYQQKLEKTREFLEPGMQAVEIGSGSGLTAISHAPYVRQIRCADTSKKMVQIARKNAKSAGAGNASFEHADLEAMNLETESVDVLFALSVLPFIEDLPATFKEIARVLKPGGILVSNTGCFKESESLFLRIVPRLGATGIIPRLNSMSIAELESYHADAGFAIEYKYVPSPETCFLIAKKG